MHFLVEPGILGVKNAQKFYSLVINLFNDKYKTIEKAVALAKFNKSKIS